MAAICVCNWKLAGKALCNGRSSDALLWYANSYLWFVRETKAGDGHFFSILDSKWAHLALEKNLWFGESCDSTRFILVLFFLNWKGLNLEMFGYAFPLFPTLLWLKIVPSSLCRCHDWLYVCTSSELSRLLCLVTLSLLKDGNSTTNCMSVFSVYHNFLSTWFLS